MSARLDYMHHSSQQTKAMYELGKASAASSIGKELLDLVNIRASLLNGCAFCLDMHVKEAKIHGERELRVYHIPIWRESTLFTPRERMALEWTEAVTKLTEHGISDQLFGQAREHFSEKELSDLTFAVAIINAWNRLSISFRNVPGSADKAMGITKSGLE